MFKKLFIVIAVLFLTSCAGHRTVGSSENQFNQTKATEDQDLGYRYLIGAGVPQDSQKAAQWFRKAAAGDNVLAQNELAFLYATGQGVPQNYAEAIKWYQKAANHGLASAQYNLGLLYLHGLGAPANKETAWQWFKKAADKNFLPAKRALNS